MKHKIEGGREAGELIDWEQEFDEIGFGNQMRVPGGKYGAKRVELKSFLRSKLLAQQEEFEKERDEFKRTLNSGRKMYLEGLKDGEKGGGYVDIDKDSGDRITGLIEYQDTIVVFKERSVWQVTLSVSSGLVIPTVNQKKVLGLTVKLGAGTIA